VCVSVYVCMYVYMHVCIYIYVSVNMYVHDMTYKFTCVHLSLAFASRARVGARARPLSRSLNTCSSRNYGNVGAIGNIRQGGGDEIRKRRGMCVFYWPRVTHWDPRSIFRREE
jgi:hypothetical protein